MSTLRRLLDGATNALQRLLGDQRLRSPHTTARGRNTSSGVPAPQAAGSAVELDVSGGLPDFRYEPVRDGDADPGEVVWTWVPFEEDPAVGKDRPVVVLARWGADLVVAQMSSRDHDARASSEARHGREWVEVGSGSWDSRGRVSEVRVDRPLLVSQSAIRRGGGVLEEGAFNVVVGRIRAHFGH